MMALVVFTGGARSGKSRAAQALAASKASDGRPVFVAVFGRESAEDAEFSQRIARHRADRPAQWTTLEVAATDDWIGEVPAEALLLVDCIGTMLGSAMEDAHASVSPGATTDADGDWLPDGFDEHAEASFAAALQAILQRSGDTIVVTNEVGDGVVPVYASSRWFRDRLGQANRALVASADAAYLVVAGRLVDLLALGATAAWPED